MSLQAICRTGAKFSGFGLYISNRRFSEDKDEHSTNLADDLGLGIRKGNKDAKILGFAMLIASRGL